MKCGLLPQRRPHSIVALVFDHALPRSLDILVRSSVGQHSPLTHHFSVLLPVQQRRIPSPPFLTFLNAV